MDVLTLHISNQNLNLVPSVEATLARISGIAAVYSEGVAADGAFPSQAVVIAKSAEAVAPALAWNKARRAVGPATVRPWTDDYSDIVLPIWRKIQARMSAPN